MPPPLVLIGPVFRSKLPATVEFSMSRVPP
jgi:hypothetical protein